MRTCTKDVDTLLLCGDRDASRAVLGASKVFLYLHGKPLFIHVLDALFKARCVGRIFIIGDKAKLDMELAKHCSEEGFPKPVKTIEQYSNLMANVWNGFLSTIDGYLPGEEKRNPELLDKKVFVLSGDAPLSSSYEMEEFFNEADMDSYDYIMGITAREKMETYYPSVNKLGIKMAYAYFREGAFRINNMHLARPFACKNRQAIQLLYNSRYQKDFKNMIRLTGDLWRHHVKLQGLVLYFLMQVSMFLSYIGLDKANWITRKYTPMQGVTAAAGRMLGMKSNFVITCAGGAALDIDNESDYETMKQMFYEWKELQRKFYE